MNQDAGGRSIDLPMKLKDKEQFLDRTDKKIFINQVKREYHCQKLLFDINLEERRCKLKKMVENETNQLISEDFLNMETVESRKNKLLEKSLQIRKQTETERQEISANKIKLSKQLNDDVTREIQYKIHRKLINADREKLKYITDVIKREDKCEDQFWNAKVLEKKDNMLANEKLITDEKQRVKLDCIEQISLKEKEKSILKQVEMENRDNNIERMKNLNQELVDDQIMKYRRSIENQLIYHSTLDKHLELKKMLKGKNQKYEDSFDNIMIDENKQKLSNIAELSVKKKQDNLKQIKDYMKYNKCLKKNVEIDDLNINKTVMEIQKELYFQRKQIELQKHKNYQDLILAIKDSQKSQILEKEKQVLQQKEDRLKEKNIYNELCFTSLKEDQRKINERKGVVQEHKNDLKAQILYNEGIRGIRQSEHQRERKSMFEAENEYNKIRNEIFSNDKLLNMHPWRLC